MKGELSCTAYTSRTNIKGSYIKKKKLRLVCPVRCMSSSEKGDSNKNDKLS